MKHLKIMLASLLLCSCAGISRSCSSWSAENFASDWLIVQYDMDLRPANCWQLKNVSVTNEPTSDGIYWEAESGNLIHLSGWYNRVQVIGNWEKAAKDIGIDLQYCKGGKYLEPKSEDKPVQPQ